MLAEGTAGQREVSNGTSGELRLTRTTSVAVAAAHDDFYDAISRGNCYVVSMQAAAALGTALTASAVTLTLYNPAGTGKNLSLMLVSLAMPVATTAGWVAYAVNDTQGQAAPTTTTAATVRNALIGGGNKNVAAAYTVATLPTAPVAVKPLAGIISTTPGGIHTISDRSALVIAPGGMVTIQGVTSNATGVISYLWEEITV